MTHEPVLEKAEPAHQAPPLSPTETRVYDLLLKRLTEQQIAREMGRSPNTTHVHVRNIYRKLGVRSRQQLFNIAKTTRRLQAGDSGK